MVDMLRYDNIDARLEALRLPEVLVTHAQLRVYTFIQRPRYPFLESL